MYSGVPNKRVGWNKHVGRENFPEINKRVVPNKHVGGKLWNEINAN